MDMYWWTNQDIKGIAIGKKALNNQINDPELAFKLAKAYQRTNSLSLANKTMDSLLKNILTILNIFNSKKNLNNDK